MFHYRYINYQYTYQILHILVIYIGYRYSYYCHCTNKCIRYNNNTDSHTSWVLYHATMNAFIKQCIYFLYWLQYIYIVVDNCLCYRKRQHKTKFLVKKAQVNYLLRGSWMKILTLLFIVLTHITFLLLTLSVINICSVLYCKN